MVEIEEKKLKGMKAVFILCIMVIAVLAVLVVYDNYKLFKAQNVYNYAWNTCSAQCNIVLDSLRSQCAIINLTPIESGMPNITIG